MGTFRKSLTGGFSGTAGSVIPGNCHGIDYLLSLPVIRKKQGPALVFTQYSTLLTSKVTVFLMALLNPLIFLWARFVAGRYYRNFKYFLATTPRRHA
jgi:hypothetical protein